MNKNKIITIIILFLFCNLISFPFVISDYTEITPSQNNRCNNQINSEWRQIYDSDSFLEVQTIDKTSDSGYILAGWTVDLSDHSDHAWLIKTDDVGNMEWNLTFGEETNAWGYSVIETSDGAFVFTGDIEIRSGFHQMFLVKADQFGNIIWNKTYYAENEAWGNCIIEVDGGYVITGKNQDDVWLVKTDMNGNILWDRTFGGKEPDTSSSVIETKDSGFMITGLTYSYDEYGAPGILIIKTDNMGYEEWNKTYAGNGYDRGSDIIETRDGCYMIAGGFAPVDQYWDDVCLLKIDEKGNEMWMKLYGGNDRDCAYAIIQLLDGSYVVTGTTHSYGLSIAGDFIPWVLKVDENGDMLWNKTFGGMFQDSLNDIVEADDGGFVLGGSTNSFTDGWPAAWLIKCEDYAPPELLIVKPEMNYLYLFDHKLMKSRRNTYIIGKITIDAEVIDPEDRIDQVEFWVESSSGTLYRNIIYDPPYLWEWDEQICDYCYMGIATFYSVNGAHVSDCLFPWMINV